MLVCLCGEGAALDVFVFASESERERWWRCKGMEGRGWNWSQALNVFTSAHTRCTERGALSDGAAYNKEARVEAYNGAPELMLQNQ